METMAWLLAAGLLLATAFAFAGWRAARRRAAAAQVKPAGRGGGGETAWIAASDGGRAGRAPDGPDGGTDGGGDGGGD